MLPFKSTLYCTQRHSHYTPRTAPHLQPAHHSPLTTPHHTTPRTTHPTHLTLHTTQTSAHHTQHLTYHTTHFIKTIFHYTVTFLQYGRLSHCKTISLHKMTFLHAPCAHTPWYGRFEPLTWSQIKSLLTTSPSPADLEPHWVSRMLDR
jgi:hypothetical protein